MHYIGLWSRQKDHVTLRCIGKAEHIRWVFWRLEHYTTPIGNILQCDRQKGDLKELKNKQKDIRYKNRKCVVLLIICGKPNKNIYFIFYIAFFKYLIHLYVHIYICVFFSFRIISVNYSNSFISVEKYIGCIKII